MSDARSPDGPSSSTRLFDAIGSQLVLHRLGAEPPRVGADYAIEEIVGAGGFGLICRATQLALQRSVALKVYPMGGERDPGVREALREARSLARLEHPGIVAVHAAGESELVATQRLPCAYVEMQLIEGLTLRQWLQAEVRPATAVVRVLLEAGRALAHAHTQGVLHRDFKPDNVMVDEAEHARVIDFGLALATDDVAGAHGPDRWDGKADALGTRATGTGLVRGTPGYMAPEASQGQPLAASDQFALAVVLREALTGRHPFVPDAGTGAPVPVEGQPTYQRLKPILDRAMAITPGERFSGVAELCDALEGARAPRRGLRMAGALAVLGLGLGAGWLVIYSDPEERGRPRDAAPAAAPAASPSSAEVVNEPETSGPALLEPDMPAGTTTTTPPPQVLPPSDPPTAAPSLSCDDLEAWSGVWQVGARVLWTEYAYQLDSRVDYELELTIEPRCAVSLLARKYPPLVESEPRGEAIVSTTRSSAVRDPGGWRIPLRLVFEGDTRTYAREEHYALDLWLDRGPAGAPRLRGGFHKANALGYVLRSGVLLGDRHLAPSARSIEVQDLPCATRCRVECAGERSQLDCRTRECTPWGDEPSDLCGPPSFDFTAPLRARAARKTVREGRSPLAQGLARGDRSMQLAACADNARLVAGRWAVWRIAKGAQAEASRMVVDLEATGCTLTGTALGGPASESIALTGEVTFAGNWILTPTEPPAWFPSPFVLTGVGAHAPAFGVDTADSMHRLRAHRLDP